MKDIRCIFGRHKYAVNDMVPEVEQIATEKVYADNLPYEKGILRIKEKRICVRCGKVAKVVYDHDYIKRWDHV